MTEWTPPMNSRCWPSSYPKGPWSIWSLLEERRRLTLSTWCWKRRITLRLRRGSKANGSTPKDSGHHHHRFSGQGPVRFSHVPPPALAGGGRAGAPEAGDCPYGPRDTTSDGVYGFFKSTRLITNPWRWPRLPRPISWRPRGLCGSTASISATSPRGRRVRMRPSGSCFRRTWGCTWAWMKWRSARANSTPSSRTKRATASKAPWSPSSRAPRPRSSVRPCAESLHPDERRYRPSPAISTRVWHRWRPPASRMRSRSRTAFMCSSSSLRRYKKSVWPCARRSSQKTTLRAKRLGNVGATTSPPATRWGYQQGVTGKKSLPAVQGDEHVDRLTAGTGRHSLPRVSHATESLQPLHAVPGNLRIR